MIKNDLLLKALRGEIVERPPVWMMRQAGRFLPEFRNLRAKHDFFTRVQTPELACEITLMPIKTIGVDAAILFSDILVIPQALGVQVLLEENKGPVLPNPIRTKAQIEQLITQDIPARLDYVMQAIKLVQRDLDKSVPLIGFAGAPWTILCYMIEGGGSKTFDKARKFCYAEPALAHQLLEKITDATIQYLLAKVQAGVNAIQLFDTWAGLLSPLDYQTFSLAYLRKIREALTGKVPVILFAKDSGNNLAGIASCQPDGIGVDWTTSIEQARIATGNKFTLQGNFDPARLLTNPDNIRKETIAMIDRFGKDKYIANLGHGILPETPVENALAFVETVKSYKHVH